MSIRLQELAELVGGRLDGDPELVIRGAATLSTASPDDISLLDKTEEAQKLTKTAACAVVAPAGFSSEEIAVIGVENVHTAFAKIVSHFRPPRERTALGISPAAHVSDTAQFGSGVNVHPGACIGEEVVLGDRCTIHSGAVLMAGCRLGEDVTVFPNAVLYENTIVGPRSIIHASAVLGAYGFGYDSTSGRHLLSAQLGYVELGADVEIGAGAMIDRGTYGPTVVGDGTKIDDLVMIAHNVRLGKHNMICSLSGIAGSSTTGDYVVLAGKVGVRDHVHIGDGAVLGALSGVMHDIPKGTCYVGIPATPEREQKLKQAALMKLPEMRKQLRQLQRAVDKLTAARAEQSEAGAEDRAAA